MIVDFFKIASSKAVCILYEALNALIVIEFFSYKLVWNDGSNNLSLEEVAQLSKIDGNILLKYLLTRSAFSS